MMPKAAPEKNKGSQLASLQFQHPAGSDHYGCGRGGNRRLLRHDSLEPKLAS
jgi:hypothetical protein